MEVNSSALLEEAIPSQTSPKSYFSLYPDLPPEIRIHIWETALTDQLAPALHLYKRGCWAARYLTAADIGFESDSADDNLVLEFATEKLGLARFDISIAAVPSEAREAALIWAAQQGVEEVQGVYQRGRPANSFACRLQADRDILYVPLDLRLYFFIEPTNLPFELDAFRDKNYSIRNEIRQVAVPATLLYSDRLTELLDLLSCLEVFYIILGPQPDFRCSIGSNIPWWRALKWDLEGAWRMAWNSITRGWHVRNGGVVQETGEGDLHRRLLRAAGDLQEGLGPFMRDFEICVVRSEIW